MKNLIIALLLLLTTSMYAQFEYEYEITTIDSFLCVEGSSAGMFGLRAVEFNGEIHMSYFMQGPSHTVKLMYAIRKDNGITTETVFEVSEYPWYIVNSRTTLQFNEEGEPHIYVALASDLYIYDYYKTDNDWQFTVVSSFINSKTHIVADPDGSNGLGFAFWLPVSHGSSYGNIAYASYSGTNWEFEQLSFNVNFARNNPSIVNHNNKTYLAYGEGHCADTLITRIYVLENNEWTLDFEDINLTTYNCGSIEGLYTKLGVSDMEIYLLYDLRRNGSHPSYVFNEGLGWENLDINFENSLTAFVNCPNIHFDSDDTGFWINENNGFNPNLSWIRSNGDGGYIDLPHFYYNYWLNDMVIHNNQIYIYYWEGSAGYPYNTPVTFKEIKINLTEIYNGITPILTNSNISLKQNVPNPFSSNTTIKFTIPKSSSVKLIVYNILGEEVSTLIDSNLPTGEYEEQFSVGENENGVYFYILSVDQQTISKKMLLVK